MSEPTPSQALLLFGLLARHGECPQAELKPAVKKADREALVQAMLIEAQKLGRGLHLKLADAGWAWIGAHLSAELPTPQRSLSDLLRRLGEYLSRRGETLADFIGSKPSSVISKAAGKSPSAKTGKKTTSSTPKRSSTTAKSPSPAAVRKRIETAYLSITGHRKDQSVRLSQLRAALPDLERATLDAGLARILQGDKKASMMRHDDPRQLDQAEREAAFNPAGEPFHVIWISS